MQQTDVRSFFGKSLAAFGCGLVSYAAYHFLIPLLIGVTRMKFANALTWSYSGSVIIDLAFVALPLAALFVAIGLLVLRLVGGPPTPVMWSICIGWLVPYLLFLARMLNEHGLASVIGTWLSYPHSLLATYAPVIGLVFANFIAKKGVRA
jgi:hypothetical protein